MIADDQLGLCKMWLQGRLERAAATGCCCLQATCEALGYSRKQLIGKNLNILLPQPFAKMHDSFVANYIRTGVSSRILNNTSRLVLLVGGGQLGGGAKTSACQWRGSFDDVCCAALWLAHLVLTQGLTRPLMLPLCCCHSTRSTTSCLCPSTLPSCPAQAWTRYSWASSR